MSWDSFGGGIVAGIALAGGVVVALIAITERPFVRRGMRMIPTVPLMPKVSPPPKTPRPNYIPPSQKAVQTTRYIEKDLGQCSYAWVCEQCDDARCFDYPLPEDIDFNFCPKRGRRITEFVKYKDPFDDYVEGE